jgi:hypothetical protein
MANDRFGNPSVNSGGKYIYSKNDPFCRKNIWEWSRNQDLDFPISAEFNTFAKNWLNTSTTVKKVRGIKALGYSNGKFGYNKLIKNSEIDDKTLELFNSLMKWLNEPHFDNSNGEFSRIDYTVNAIQKILSVDNISSIVFGTNYNQLNTQRRKDDLDIDITPNYLYRKGNQLINDLSMTSHIKAQESVILSDCRTVFDAQLHNVTHCKVGNYDDFMDSLPSSFTQTYGTIEDNNKLIANNLFSSYSSFTENFPESTKAIFALSVIMNAVTVDGVNSRLGLHFTKEDYLYASKQMFTLFTIPFYYGNITDELNNMLSVGYGIHKEENRLDKPSDNLLMFAYQMARTVRSKAFRVNLENVRGGVI